MKKNYELTVCQWNIYRTLVENKMLTVKERYEFIKIFQLDDRESIKIGVNNDALFDEVDEALIYIFTKNLVGIIKYNATSKEEEYFVPEDLLEYVNFPFRVVKIADEIIDGIVFSVFTRFY